jgi:hypothetical protein
MKEYYFKEGPKITFTRISDDGITPAVELFTDNALRVELQKAVNLDEYEMAVVYRDELSRRKLLNCKEQEYEHVTNAVFR